MRSIRNVRQILWAAGLGSLVSFGSCLSEAEEVWISRQVLTNVAQFYRAVGAEHQANYAAQLEGVIGWADSNQNSFVLEDDSGAVFVKANFEGAAIRLGSRVRLEGDCAAQRTGLAVGMTEALVVDNDGLHDDLGGGLTEISMLGSLATDGALPSDRRTSYLAQMTEKARALVGALDEIVWAVNPRYNSLSSLTAYYSLYAQRFLSLASLRCRLEVAPELPDASVDSRVRHSLFLAFKEALNNVIRHAEASEVRLRILAQAEELIVSVADNGRGLPPGVTTASGMDGLANMPARLSAMGGRCEVQSVPAQGTTVILGVRLPRQNHDQSSHS